MDYKLFSSCLSILFTIFFIAQNSIDLNPIRFHCKNYILNSYLYIFLAIAIIISTVFSMNNFNIDDVNLFTGSSKFLLILVSLILLVSVMTIKPNYFFTKHILYILWIILLGIFVYPIYRNNKYLFYTSSISTLIIIFVLSILAFKYPNFIKESWNFYLFTLLLGLFVAVITENLLRNHNVVKTKKYNKLLSYGTIILFSFFMLYDTKMLIKNSKLCGVSLEPDYINQSIDIVLNSLNIFTGITNIKE